MKEENNNEKEEDMIKEMIIDADFEEDPPVIEDYIEWTSRFTYIIAELMIAMADKMGIDTKELLGDNHPDYEDEEED